MKKLSTEVVKPEFTKADAKYRSVDLTVRTSGSSIWLSKARGKFGKKERERGVQDFSDLVQFMIGVAQVYEYKEEVNDVE